MALCCGVLRQACMAEQIGLHQDRSGGFLHGGQFEGSLLHRSNVRANIHEIMRLGVIVFLTP
jgi:hypothetical protein